MELEYDTDTMVFHALRVFRNAFIGYVRVRLQPVFGEGLDDEIRTLYKKEWDEIERSARQAHESGLVSRIPMDALDYLSVSHTYVLLEKYWAYLCPDPAMSSDETKRIRSQLTSWSRELIGIRNPVSHAPQEPLAVRDALRYIDSAARILAVLRVPEASELWDQWNGLVADLNATGVAPRQSLIRCQAASRSPQTSLVARITSLTFGAGLGKILDTSGRSSVTAGKARQPLHTNLPARHAGFFSNLTCRASFGFPRRSGGSSKASRF